MTKKVSGFCWRNDRLAPDVDFRTGQEKAEAPDPALPGVEYVENPILSDQAHRHYAGEIRGN